MKIFVVNENSEHAMSAAMKIAKQARPGVIIPLTADEMRAMTHQEFHPLELPDPEKINVGELREVVEELKSQAESIGGSYEAEDQWPWKLATRIEDVISGSV